MLIFLMPHWLTSFPTPLAAKAPAMPHKPKVPTISLPEKKGASANLKARQDQMAIMLPKLKAARTA